MTSSKALKLMLLQLMTICIYLLASHFTLGRASPSDISLPVIKDPGLKAEIVLYGLDHPTQMAFLSPADFLVIEKNSGKVIRVINDTALSRPLIDVKVANKIERGLLGLAVSKNLNTVSDSDDEKISLKLKYICFIRNRMRMAMMFVLPIRPVKANRREIVFIGTIWRRNRLVIKRSSLILQNSSRTRPCRGGY